MPHTFTTKLVHDFRRAAQLPQPMLMAMPPLDTACVRYARFMRSGLGRTNATCDVVRSLLAVQAQDSEAALLSIYARSRGDRDAIANVVLRGEGDVARVWGMRCTLQVVHRQDWHVVCAAVRQNVRKTTMNAVCRYPQGETVFDTVMSVVVKILEGGSNILAKDVEACIDRVISEKDLKDLEGWREISYAKACFKRSVHVLATMHGHAERVYPPDRAFTPAPTSVMLAPRKEDTPWKHVEVMEAVKLCAMRFFSAYAPASEIDFRYWMGIAAATSKCAVSELQEEGTLVAVPCIDSATTLFAHEAVAAEVHATVAPVAEEWPVCLLGRFDPLLLAHKSKNWLIGERHRRRVWTKNADITPTVLVRGRIRGQWRRVGAKIVVRLFAPCEDDKWVANSAEVAQIRACGLELLTKYWCVGSSATVVIVRELHGGREEVMTEDASENSADLAGTPEPPRRQKRRRKSWDQQLSQ